jgi:hypothetical protein
VGDEPLQLREPLVLSHEVPCQPSPDVLPEELRARLQSDEDEDAAQDVVGGVLRRREQLSLESRQDVGLSGTRRAVHEERVGHAARRRVDAREASPEDVGVDLGDIGRRLPCVLDDVVLERIRQRSELHRLVLPPQTDFSAMPT